MKFEGAFQQTRGTIQPWENSSNLDTVLSHRLLPKSIYVFTSILCFVAFVLANTVELRICNVYDYVSTIKLL